MGGTKIFDPRVKLPKGYVPFDSFKMVHGGDALHDFDIGAGECRDDGDSADIVVGALTKQIDAVFAAGNNAGGLDVAPPITAGVVGADWAILRPDTGASDHLYSESFTAPTLPANYTKKQLVGMFWVNGSSEIITMLHTGNYFRATGDIINDINDNSITADTYEVGTLSVPRLCLAHVYGQMENTTTTSNQGRFHIITNGANDAFNFPEAWLGQHSGATFEQHAGIGMVLVDGSSQIQYGALEIDGAATVRIRVLGCLMLTRGNP